MSREQKIAIKIAEPAIFIYRQTWIPNERKPDYLAAV